MTVAEPPARPAPHNDVIASRLADAIAALRPRIEAHITTERVRRYLTALAETPAPSTAASAFRTPVLRDLLGADGVLGDTLHLVDDFERTGSTVMFAGTSVQVRPLWYFAHLDTISYLIQSPHAGRYPLVPFCYHLIKNGRRKAEAYRFDRVSGRYRKVVSGRLESEAGSPFFRPVEPTDLLPGDRIVPVTPYREDLETGEINAHVDNAGGVAALAVAAPLLAETGVPALLAFPDEEEGPVGTGSQVMGRGGTRIVNLMPTPDLAIVIDVQQAGDDQAIGTGAGAENTTRLGSGAVLAEFSSLARGAVTPPHLYTLAMAFRDAVRDAGVSIQESNNAYTSRSDDVSVLLKTPNILLLGFPGFDRHFDRALPRANLHDVVNLAKALVYVSALQPLYRDLRDRMTGGDM